MNCENQLKTKAKSGLKNSLAIAKTAKIEKKAVFLFLHSKIIII